MDTNYYVFLHSPGPNWLPEKTVLDQPLDEHFAYMDQLQAAGTLVLGGGFLDGSGAMGVLLANSLTEAEQFVANDPAVKKKLVTASVHPWFVTVPGKIEKSMSDADSA